MRAPSKSARRFLVHGRVQGVGYRYFAERAAVEIGVSGYARNLEDGSVEVYAIGSAAQLSEFEARVRQGPRWADVRGVEAREETIDAGVHGFLIR